jgi:hypothetical protein
MFYMKINLSFLSWPEKKYRKLVLFWIQILADTTDAIFPAMLSLQPSENSRLHGRSRNSLHVGRPRCNNAYLLLTSRSNACFLHSSSSLSIHPPSKSNRGTFLASLAGEIRMRQPLQTSRKVPRRGGEQGPWRRHTRQRRCTRGEWLGRTTASSLPGAAAPGKGERRPPPRSRRSQA